MNAGFGPVILVIGMHRSGTSAVTRVLNLLGVELGQSLLPPADDNIRGFWEHQDAVLIHEGLLSALGSKWSDLRGLPVGWLSMPAALEAKQQLKELFFREFSGALVWAIKDPRICRLLPLWRSALEEMGVKAHALFVVRHPNEVARSLQARDGISLSQSRLAWTQHMAEAEIASRGMPRAVLLYDDLLAQWPSSMGRVAAELGIQWPIDVDTADAEVRNFLDPTARHYFVAENATVELPRLVQKIYDALVSVARGTGSWPSVSTLSDIYDGAADSFLSPLEDIVAQAGVGGGGLLDDSGASMGALLVTLEARLAAMERYIAYDKVVDDVAKLYFRSADQAHVEDRAVLVNHDGLSTGQRIKFELPAGNKIDFLRFDPSEFGGTFAIFELRIDDIALENIERYVVAVNQCRVSSGPDRSLRISSEDNDPYVEFSLGAVGSPATIQTCTVGVRRESLDNRMLDACAAAMRSVAAEFRAAEVEHASVTLEPLQRSIEDIRDGQAMLQSQHRQRLEELRLEAHSAGVALEPLQRSVEDIRDGQAMLQSQYRQQLEELRLEIQRAAVALEPLQRSVEDTRDGQTMLQRYIRQQLAELRLHQHETQQQMQSLSAQVECEKGQLEILVGAYERTFSARWHLWLRKRRVK